MINIVYRLYDFTPLSASVYILEDFKPSTNAVKSLSMYIYRLEKFTPLVTNVKSHIYTLPTGNKIMPLVTSVISYSIYNTDCKKLRRLYVIFYTSN